MQAVQGSPAATPFRLYSGHDTGPIIPFLSAFGVWDGVWPTYASMITLELHQFQANTSKYAVRMTYNGDVMKVRKHGVAGEGGAVTLTVTS